MYDSWIMVSDVAILDLFKVFLTSSRIICNFVVMIDFPTTFPLRICGLKNVKCKIRTVLAC